MTFEEYLKKKHKFSLDDFFMLSEPKRNIIRNEYWEREEQSMQYQKPTKEQFIGYLRVQKSGVTNMWNTQLVCELAYESGLTKENCLYIFNGNHYSELCEEYGISMKNI